MIMMNKECNENNTASLILLLKRLGRGLMKCIVYDLTFDAQSEPFLQNSKENIVHIK